MTITKSVLDKFVESLKAAGVTGKALMKACKEFTHGHTFADDEGNELKLSMADYAGSDEPDGDEPDGKAIKSMIADAVKTAFDDNSVKIQLGQPKVDVITPEERILKEKNWGFQNSGDFAVSVKNSTTGNHLDERLDLIRKADRMLRVKAPTTYASELVGADGGFAVPPDIRQEIWVAVSEGEGLLSMTDLTPTNSNVVILPADETTPWQSTGGILAYRRAQGQTMTQSKVQLQTRNIVLNEYYALVPATDELLSDAPRLNNYLMNKAPEKISYLIDDDIFRGNGSGAMLGILNSPSLISSTKTSAPNALVASEIFNMYSRLLETGTKSDNICWFVTPRMITLLQQLALGTSVGYPLWLPNRSIEGPALGTLLGYPVRKSFHASALNSLGDILLANMKGYAAYNHTSGFDFQSSIHLFFDAGATAFRWRVRVGGEPYLRTPVTPPQDITNTVSHFVALAAR